MPIHPEKREVTGSTPVPETSGKVIGRDVSANFGICGGGLRRLGLLVGVEYIRLSIHAHIQVGTDTRSANDLSFLRRARFLEAAYALVSG